MSQVDLATLVSACAGGGTSDRKIACEPPADDDNEPTPDKVTPDPASDAPPESFWLSKDAEYDWFDRNAFLERKESTRGNSNSGNLNPNLHPSSNPSSQRFSRKMIGLPKTQKTTYADPAKRKNTIRLFPKRSASVVKAGVVEPTSPKVSCMGRVRSKRGRRKSTGSTEQTTSIERKRRSLFSCGGVCNCMPIFRSGRGNKPAGQAVEQPPRRSPSSKYRDNSVRADTAAVAEPPGLGGMARFASGRRSSASWGIDDLGGETR